MTTQRINIRPGPPWRDGTEVLPRGHTGGGDLSEGEMPLIRTSGRVQGSGPSIQSTRHPDPDRRSGEPARHTCTRMAGGGSARLDQILRPAKAGLRMTDSRGSGGPPWLAVQHREVDVGHLGPPDRQAVGSSGSIHNCQLLIINWQLCSTPPIRYERARESIARLVVITSNLPKVHVNAKATLGRCKTTRSCASDAEHEFSRARSPGLYPMLSFRDTRGPQLLLMRPSSLCKGVVGHSQLYEAFS